jgi:signal transduction histidine kinase
MGKFPSTNFLGQILILISVLAICRPASAQGNEPPPPAPVVLTDEQGEYPLGLHLEILEDPSGELTIDQVASPEFDAQFTPSKVEVPNYGFTNSAYWVRLDVQNETTFTDHWLLEQGFANLHFVDLYTPLPEGGGYTIKKTGVLRPSATRDVPHPRIIFDLVIPPQSQETIYLRFQNGASMTLPLTLWTQAAFLNQSLVELILRGVFYGTLAALLFYNLFLLMSVREASYLYFVSFLTSLIIQEISYDGYWALYITPNWNYLKQNINPWSYSLLMASLVLFSDSFLEIKSRFPKLHRGNLVILASWGALILLAPFTSYHFTAVLAVPLGLVSLMIAFVEGIVSWSGGFRPTRFFLLAWLGMLVSIFWLLLIRLGITSSTLLSENLYRPGIAWMAVCWSLALADRINLLKAQTEDANRLLRNSEHKLSQILEGLPIGVVVYGKDQRPSYVNRRTVDILSNPAQGIRVDPSLRRTLAQAMDYFSFHKVGSKEKYPLEKLPVYSALQGEPASADDVEADLKDRRVPLEIWASPVRDESGNVEAALVAFQDITRRKQADTELEEYRKSLEALVEKRTAEISAINTWLSALNKVHQTLGGMADLPQAYQKLSATILELLDARGVFTLRWGEPSEQYEVLCLSFGKDLSSGLMDRLKNTFQADTSLRQDVERGKMIRLTADQAISSMAWLQECTQKDEFEAFVLAPMISYQTVVGVMGVALPDPLQEFSPQKAGLVERIALDLTNLAQDAYLLDQALILAKAEERNRLARDLHDSVTQVLFSASLIAEILPQIWRRNPEKGMQSLEKLRRLSRGALAEMRTMLLELRPAAMINTPLGELLAQLTEAVTSRSGLPYQLFIEPIPSLPEEVQTSFYRIAQEALNNVVKHAQANCVIVKLNSSPISLNTTEGSRRNVELLIQDDGVGYASEGKRSDHLGLEIMQERAAAIHSTLTVESKPGYGTQVKLLWYDPSGSKS